jgi:pyruvate dehydrogenase E2 component (dihydrolipoamide acetyltransferase)
MAKVVELPRLSDTMEEGVVAKWLVKPGDKVKRGQPIAEIETDKATMEFESFDAGTVLELLASEGTVLKLGTPIAILGEAGEDVAAVKAGLAGGGTAPAVGGSPASAAPVGAKEPAAAMAKAVAAPPVTAPAAAPQVASREGGRVPASPLARRLAHEAGLDLGSIAGSGPHGRVVKADVDAAALRGPQVGRASGGAPAAFTAEVDAHGRPYATRVDRTFPLSQMRKAIVRAMVKSKTEAPHFYLTIDVDMEHAVELRARINAAAEATKGAAGGATKISFNDLVVAAAARALQVHPRVNAKFTAEGIVEYGDIDVGVAVAIDDGLLVPVVRHAEQKTLRAIARETRDLGERAKAKTLHPNEMTGSTFTVSNLGMFGIEEFAAVVNPGEGAILAVGAIREAAVVVGGSVQIRHRMKMTLSCDHRVVDGAVGAKFLQTLQSYLEEPLQILAS